MATIEAYPPLGGDKLGKVEGVVRRVRTHPGIERLHLVAAEREVARQCIGHNVERHASTVDSRPPTEFPCVDRKRRTWLLEVHDHFVVPIVERAEHVGQCVELVLPRVLHEVHEPRIRPPRYCRHRPRTRRQQGGR